MQDMQNMAGQAAADESRGHHQWHGLRRIQSVATLVGVTLAAFLIVQMMDELRYPGGANATRPTITVDGTGEVFAKPDVATVSFSVTEEADAVSKAQDTAATSMNAILAALRTAGVADKDIKTTGYSIYPRYEYARVACTATFCPPEGKRSLAAYVVSQSVSVKIRDISKAGSILSQLGELGATDLSGLSFDVDNDDGLRAAARDKAIADAQKKAEVLASELGVSLVRLVGYSEGGMPVRYAAMKAMDSVGMAGAAPAPEVPSGENQFTSNVSITYEVR